MSMHHDAIDFVILWVDPNDQKWQAERALYQSSQQEDAREVRYRDWDNLHYIFRGIERFTPWVRKVHFITCGQLPAWLNVDHPKLNIVQHKDYIPEAYLPVFNSDPIELNLHRLESLSEHFVLFNDDMFITGPLKEEDFFWDGLPRDAALLNVHCYNQQEMFTLAPFLNIGIINKYFNMKQVLKNNFLKWYSPKYGFQMLRNLYLLPCPKFPGMRMDHLPCAHLKSTFQHLWEIELEVLDQSSKNRFRSQLSVSQWLMKEWNMVSGNFVPRSTKVGKSFGVSSQNADYIAEVIRNQRYHLLCLNDTEMGLEEFEMCKEKVNRALDAVLHEKSGFEK